MNTKLSARRISALVAATLFASAFIGHAAPVVAAGVAPPTMTVKFFDLDMTRASDASILYRRIRQAADMVCEPLSRGPALPSRPFDTCVGNAIDGAVAKVNAPALNAVYAAKTGKPTPGARVAIARN